MFKNKKSTVEKSEPLVLDPMIVWAALHGGVPTQAAVFPNPLWAMLVSDRRRFQLAYSCPHVAGLHLGLLKLITPSTDTRTNGLTSIGIRGG